MPRLNKTGPMGTGPGTGRGMGPCGKGMAYGPENAGQKRGLGWRRFCRCRVNPLDGIVSLNEEEEVKMLSHRRDFLKEQLEAVESRLSHFQTHESQN